MKTALSFIALLSLVIPGSVFADTQKLEEYPSVPAYSEIGISKEKVDADYKALLKKANKCETKYWTRYEFAGYFAPLAAKNKITPFDLASGDPYKTRNISRLVVQEAGNNYLTYWIYHMPEPAKQKMEQEFPTESEKEKNQKAIFNEMIKRDYACYKKLK